MTEAKERDRAEEILKVLEGHLERFTRAAQAARRFGRTISAHSHEARVSELAALLADLEKRGLAKKRGAKRQCPCEGEAVNPGPGHIKSCPFRDPNYGNEGPNG